MGNIFTSIFNVVAVPFGYVMGYIYQFLQSYGYSIIAFALLAKLVMLPLSMKQKKSMAVTQRLQPKLQEIQKKYGNDKERYTAEMQRLYADAGASPMGSCGTTILTLPIMIGLYYVVVSPLTYFMHMTAEEISAVAAAVGASATGIGSQLSIAGLITPENLAALQAICSKVLFLDFNFYGINLAARPQIASFGLMWILPVISALTSYGLSQVTTLMNQAASGVKQDEKTAQMNQSMTYMMPLMSLWMGFTFPAGVTLYWICNNLFSCVQEVLLTTRMIKQEKAEKELYKSGGSMSIK